MCLKFEQIRLLKTNIVRIYKEKQNAKIFYTYKANPVNYFNKIIQQYFKINT
jgi:hypothetical protein